MTALRLPAVERILAVVAHPDDETFGLGAVLSAFVDAGTAVAVVSLTRGEASTLGGLEPDLAMQREQEFRAAAAVLGIEPAAICHYPDGRLASVPMDELVSTVEAHAKDAELVVVFDEGGITGHPDHRRATEAVLEWADTSEVPVLAWTVPEAVARRLNHEFGAGFTGRAQSSIDVELLVDRTRQLRAISCHRSQAVGNDVLRRRLELQNDGESLRYLSRTPDVPDR
jgi:LmbE family N-acetylglucosaminyl deacetylase